VSTLPDRIWDVPRAAELLRLVELKDTCIARMRAEGIDQWDEIYPDNAVIERDRAAGTLHVTRRGTHILGCVTVDTKHDPLWSGMAWIVPSEQSAVVHRLMVDPAAQRRGLARQLMADAERRAVELGFLAVHLDCFLANPAALALYERLGYRRVGTAQMRKGLFVCFEKALLGVEA
jgi:ribosomal protein S18 acetylase RimI-like enzyme